MIKVSDDLVVNPVQVASMSWDRGHTYTALVIHMADGKSHRVKHQPNAFGGTDCYLIEARIMDAFNRATVAQPTSSAEG